MFRKIKEAIGIEGRVETLIIMDDSFSIEVPRGTGFFLTEIVRLYHSKGINVPRNVAAFYRRHFFPYKNHYDEHASDSIKKGISLMNTYYPEFPYEPMIPCVLYYYKWMAENNIK